MSKREPAQRCGLMLDVSELRSHRTQEVAGSSPASSIALSPDCGMAVTRAPAHQPAQNARSKAFLRAWSASVPSGKAFAITTTWRRASRSFHTADT
jgi:hypothetical protein